MPPDLDIYVLTRQRDRHTIGNFLVTFVDRAASEDRGDEELMMVPLSNSHRPPGETDEWDWEPAITLTHALERGLAYPRRAFTLYLTAARKSLDRANLTFTIDDQLVLGLSIDDEGELPENERLAKKLLHQLARLSDAYLGLVSWEYPAPLSERTFREADGHPRTLFFWQRDAE